MAISRFSTSSVAQGLPKYQKLWDGVSAILDSDYELIERITLSGSASTVTFSSIPSTYSHLEVRFTAKCAYAATGVGGSAYKIQLNSDTGTNYSFQQFNSNGTGLSASSAGSNYMWGVVPWDGAGGFSGALYSPAIIKISDYTNTTKNKSILVSDGFMANSTSTNQFVAQRGGAWYNTNAVTSITLDSNTPYADGAWGSNSTFALYGIKGA